MDMEKLMKWRTLAENFYGEDFWSWIFDDSKKNSKKGSFHPFQFENEQKNKFPPVDIFMNENEVIILVELPGLEKEDVQLAIALDQLKIKGQTKSPFPKDTGVIEERYKGEFERTIKLPELVKKDRATAKFINGVLYIRVPKEDQGSNSKNINIE